MVERIYNKLVHIIRELLELWKLIFRDQQLITNFTEYQDLSELPISLFRTTNFFTYL